MSVHTRKSHIRNSIEVIVDDVTKIKFTIPRKVSRELFTFLRLHQINIDKNELIPADQVFKNLDQKHGKIGVTIKGLRARDNLTQLDLAKKLKIHQTHVSQIENGKRCIGKKLAQKLATVFHSDYRLFL